MATTSNANNPAINTPKTGYAGDNSGVKTPGAFEIKRLIMTNSKGVKKDLKALNLVDSFTITTELFSPVVTFTATIRDNENFIDDKEFDICGQETIEIEIDPLIAGDAIKQTFYVKEYVNYTKTLDFPNTQIYSLVAISEFAYRSSLMNICRVVDKNQTVAENIKTIFIEDLGFNKKDGFNVDGDVSTKFEGIINIQRPLKAAEWLRSRCFEENGSPFFLHSNITQPKRIFLSSWKSLSAGAIVATYKYRQQSEEIPGTTKHTIEERSRILSMSSNIKFDRLASANAGAYASRLNVTDYAAKTYYTLDFKSKATKDWTPQKYKIKNREGAIVEDATMHNIPSANTASVHINTAINPDGKGNSVTNALYPNISIANAFIARLNEINHEIVVYGDTAFNPGVKLKLQIPKTLRERTIGQGKDNLDPVVSGEFMIVVAAHVFSNGIYTNKLKLVRIGGVEALSGADSIYIPSNTSTSEVAVAPNTNPNPNNTVPLPNLQDAQDTQAAQQGLGILPDEPSQTAVPGGTGAITVPPQIDRLP